MIKNIKLTFAYDGSKFSGMQSQKDGLSIQDALEKAIYKLTSSHSRLIIAGRTDAGVHAYGQVANFLTAYEIPGLAYKYKLRPFLDDSIAIIDSSEVGLDFHARFSAKSKTYEYRIYNGAFLHPNLRHAYCHVSYNLDLEKLTFALNELVGAHDFKAFSKYEDTEKNTVRVLESADLNVDGDFITLKFKGQSFLYNQIRIMVGSLIDIARGHRSLGHIKELLESRDRLQAGITYGPEGLYLIDIEY